MDRARFDNLARSLASRLTRRRATELLLALGIGMSGGFEPHGADEILARKKRKKCKGNKKRCGKRCIPKTQCCTGADCGPGGSCQGGTCLCPAEKKPCHGACIADATCCTNDECGAGNLCAGGVCVMGQGTCPSQADACDTVIVCQINEAPDPNCVCFRTTSGATRCGANDILDVTACETDADCAELFPEAAGIFCAQGGGDCPFAAICQAPCACVPDCAGKVCGDDGCGGTCGTCPVGQPLCTPGGQCIPIPDIP